MKILMISTDKNILKENSEARQRMIEYGSLVDVLHIIVFTKRDANNMNSARLSVGEAGMMRIANNVFVYSTNSRSRWFYIFDAVKIGKEIIQNPKSKIQNSAITAQDPFEAGFVGFWLKKKFGIPLQLQIHTDFLSPYFRKESFLNKIRVRIAKFLIPRANCIRVVSERIRTSLNSKFQILNSHITVLPIFVDIKKIEEASIKTDLHKKYPQFDFIILMASRLTKEKNIGLAIEAMAEISKSQIANRSDFFESPRRSRDKSILLLIVGEGPELKNLQLKTYNLQLENNVKFEPWADDLISYYKTADLFLLTSNYEGYGRTIIEAAASGCGVVSSDVGIADEASSKDNTFEPGDKKELKEKIIDAINGNIKPPKSIKSLSKEEYLENYKKSWQQCLDGANIIH